MNIYKNINPVLEVVHYFNRRINGSSISDTMLQLEHTYSDRQEEIHPLISRIIQIEFLLNSELMADFDRLSFFFRRLDGAANDDSIDFLPASLLLLDTVYHNFQGMDGIRSCLAEKSQNTIRREICTALSSDGISPPDVSDLDALMEFIYTLPFPDEAKWRILDLCRHYFDYLDELLELLQPAVQLVEKNRPLFDDLIRCCSQEQVFQDEFPAYNRSLIGFDISDYGCVEIYPMVLGFNAATVVPPDSPSDPLRIYIGVLMRLMGSNMVTIDIAELARSMKSLGDPTRLEMLCCIKNQSTYGQELSNRFGVTSTTVYHHMNKLLMVGLAESKLEGNRVYFSMNRQGVSALIEQLKRLLLEES